MISILLEDLKNKLFHVISNLSEERELHIRDNIIALNKVECLYTVHFWVLGDSTINLEKKGYKQDQGLYDRRMLDYNNDNPQDVRTLWIK